MACMSQSLASAGAGDLRSCLNTYSSGDISRGVSLPFKKKTFSTSLENITFSNIFPATPRSDITLLLPQIDFSPLFL